MTGLHKNHGIAIFAATPVSSPNSPAPAATQHIALRKSHGFSKNNRTLCTHNNAALLSAWSSGGTNHFTGITADGDRDDLSCGTGDNQFWAEILPAAGFDYLRDAALGESVHGEA